MKSLIIDSTDKVIYDGDDAKKVLELLLASPSDITEKDEVKYEDILRNSEWTGELRMERHFDIELRGIDDWNRVVFKDVDSNAHFGDVDKLWSWNTPRKEIIEYYQNDDSGLVYFGTRFDCDPNGGKSDIWKFNIVSR